MVDQQEDLELLTNSLADLLQGELKLGLNIMGVGKALKREGKNKQWIANGIKKWTDENEDAIPLIAMALGEAGLSKLQAYLNK